MTVKRRDAREPVALGVRLIRTSNSLRPLSVWTPHVTRAAGWPKRTNSAACCVRGERVSADSATASSRLVFPCALPPKNTVAERSSVRSSSA